MMKLKINKKFIKKPRLKKNKKNKDWSWNSNQEDQVVISKKEERKEEENKRSIGNKIDRYERRA